MKRRPCLLLLSIMMLMTTNTLAQSPLKISMGIMTGSHKYADSWITAINPSLSYEINDTFSTGITLNLPIELGEASSHRILHSTGGELWGYGGYSLLDGRLKLGAALVGGVYLQGFYKYENTMDAVPYAPGTPEYEEWSASSRADEHNKIRWQLGVRPAMLVKVSEKISLYGSYGFLGLTAPKDELTQHKGAASEVRFGFNNSPSFANAFRVGIIFSLR